MAVFIITLGLIIALASFAIAIQQINSSNVRVREAIESFSAQRQARRAQRLRAAHRIPSYARRKHPVS